MGSTVMESNKKDNSKKKGILRINMPNSMRKPNPCYEEEYRDLRAFTSPILDTESGGSEKDGSPKGEVCFHSASLTKGLFVRGCAAGVCQPSSPMFAPAHSQSQTSPGSSRTIFPYPSTHQDRSPPKSPCRLNFSGIFRSSSNSSSNSSIKLFSRTKIVTTLKPYTVTPH